MEVLKPRTAVLAGAVFLFSAGSLAAPESATESEVKAAYLYNFANFITWPKEAFADPQAPVVFGVLGDDPSLNLALDQALKDKKICGRETVLKEFRSVEGLGTCHVLFVAATEEHRWSEVHAAIGKKSTLTVSDLEGFTLTGGIIRFFMEKKRLRFEINIDAAERAQLKMSAKLLKLAVIVRDRPEER